MKFKTIFFLFNGIILFSFLFIALMPLFVLGGEYTRIFWGENWFLALIFIVFISVLDGYFIINWKMFSLLEKEDWPGLTRFLENEIYEKKRLSGRNIKMLINTSLTVSNLEKIVRLEEEVKDKKPKFLGIYGTQLGIPYLLNQNLEKGRPYYTECINRAKDKDKSWLQWCLAFLLLSDKEIEESRPMLIHLSSYDKDPVLQLLSLYLLSTISKEIDEVQTQNKEGFLSRYPGKSSLDKIIQKSKSSNIVVLLLASILDDAIDWLYGSNLS